MFIPYGRQSIDDDDIRSVVDVLRSDWLTTGPLVGKFEEAVAEFCGSRFGVAVSSGTAALHAAMYAAGIKSGDEVIVPSITFVASANAAVYLGAKPVLVDVVPDTLLLDLQQVASRIGPKTRAIVAVDYAGHPCDYTALRELAESHGLVLIADACHSIGGEYLGKPVGTLADLSCFSFHPVKHITTAEGGMVMTGNEEYARRMRLFRNHGISTDHRERHEKGTFHYEMVDLGYNYRLNDVQCALGLSQLKKLQGWIDRRNCLAERYIAAFAEDPFIKPLSRRGGLRHAYHLFVVRGDFAKAGKARGQVAKELRELGIGVNVHYPPVHLHPFYRERFSYQEGDFPVAEAAAAQILSLPMYASLSDAEQDKVIVLLKRAFS